MFGKDKVNTNADSPDSGIPILTIDHFPSREYEVVDMVTARYFDTKIRIGKLIDLNEIVPELQKVAYAKGLDAVIGTRIQQQGDAVIIGYGTGIRFK